MKPCLSLLILLIITNSSYGTELSHRFANPNFIGGDAAKGIFLLNEANSQNSFTAPIKPTKSGSTTPTKTPLQQFSDKIQSALLNTISTAQTKAIKDAIIDPATGYVVPNVEVPLSGDYTIRTLSPDLVNGTLTMIISDGISNTSFTVPYLAK